MKYDEFTAACDREWLQGPPFGDVTALSLTDASLRELDEDLAGRPDLTPLILRIPAEGTGPHRPFLGVGGLPAGLQNPVTRSDVTVTGGAEADTATVSYGTSAWSPPPRTVTIGGSGISPGEPGG